MQQETEENVIDQGSPRQVAEVLSNVFNLVKDGSTDWDTDELGEILIHQLSAPVELEISRLNLTTDERHALKQVGLKPDQSIHDLFIQPNPPLELLHWVKEYAKAASGDPRHPIPAPICSILYYASIAKARWRYRERITTIDDEAIREGLLWALEQSWLDRSLKLVFRSCLETFQID